jgi:DNA-binding MarR family transcriptional regulator
MIPLSQMETTLPPAPPSTPAEVRSGELGELLGRLRRALRRRVRESGAFPFPQLQEAQLEVLRLLSHSTGLRVQQAALALQLRPNTVSTLVAGLVRQGLVARSVDPDDGRAVRLELTAAARRRLTRWRDHRRAVLDDALTGLDDHDRATVAAALGALSRLATRLEEGGR